MHKYIFLFKSHYPLSITKLLWQIVLVLTSVYFVFHNSVELYVSSLCSHLVIFHYLALTHMYPYCDNLKLNGKKQRLFHVVYFSAVFGIYFWEQKRRYKAVKTSRSTSAKLFCCLWGLDPPSFPFSCLFSLSVTSVPVKSLLNTCVHCWVMC